MNEINQKKQQNIFMTQIYLITLLFSLIENPLLAKNPIYHFEQVKPEITALAGTLEKQTFPGLPGYESIKNGDHPEKGWYLRLIRPIDVEASKSDTDPNSSTEKNIKIVQLANCYTSPEKKLLREKKNVWVKGYFFHALTGHHHSRVLFWVEKMEERTR